MALLVAASFLARPAALANAEGDLERRLRELKEVCDKGLLSETECKETRASIMDRFATGSSEPEKQKDVGESCNYVGEITIASFEDSQAFNPSANALQIVREILNEAGLAQNFVVREGNVANAAAVVSGYERFILYSPAFLAQLKGVAGTNWAVYSVMAHEIAHHLQGHTLTPGGSRPPTELEADEYSGFILAKLGATLEESRAGMSKFGSPQGSATHPPRDERLAAITAGWNKASRTTRPPAPPPSTGPDDDEDCRHECDRAGERECVDDLEERVCRRDADGCLVWEANVCDDGEECRGDRCRAARDGRGTGRPHVAAYCCDMYGNRRCVQTINPSAVGAPCLCLGLGTGIGCD